MLDWLRARRDRIAGERRATRDRTPVPAAPPTSPMDWYRRRAFERADELASTTLAVDPDHVESRLVRSLVALARGKPQEAVRIAQAALVLSPGEASLHVALGRAQAALGRHPLALASYTRALALDPSSADAHLQLGLVALRTNRLDDASRHLGQAADADPALADAQFHLGDLLRRRGDLGAAEARYRQALRIDADHPEALANLGGLLNDGGRRDEAAALFERVLATSPDLSPVSFNLALIRIDQRRWVEAATLLRASLACDPRQADAHYWLGNVAMALGDDAAARAEYHVAVQRDATLVQARWGFVMAQLPAIAAAADAQDAAVVAFGREVTRLKEWLRTRKPVDAHRAVGAQQPFYLAYVPGNHRDLLGAYGELCVSLMSAWARRVGVPAPQAAGPVRLRVGIVSAHLHSHSVWHALVRGWVEHLDPAQFELHLFHVGRVHDTETEWATRRVRQFHAGIGTWEDWAKRLSDSRLDVILYPEIAMDATTLRLAALRLARVQLAGWGHPITTGLPTIDGYVTAEAFEPNDADAQYVERLIRLPRLGSCYRPYGTQPAAPDLAGSSLAAADRFVLCAGTAFKYAPRHDGLLVDLARRCAPCKLVFFATTPEPIAAAFEVRLRHAFELGGVSFEACVRIVPWQSQAQFFGLLDRADVFVDSVDFSGFNTAMQAVERGVPIVAWRGRALRGRFASAILEALRLDEWVAENEGDFVALVAKLCGDDTLRRTVRRTIEERRPSLYDDRATVGALADAIRTFGAQPGGA